MTAIKNWSTTPIDNSDAPPAGAPENATRVSDVNNIIRQIMAEVRDWYEIPDWRNLGDTPALVDSTTFSVTDNTLYHVGQRIKITDGTVKLATIAGKPNATDVRVHFDNALDALSAPTVVHVAMDPRDTTEFRTLMSGNVGSGGAALTRFPDGWSVSRTSAGIYAVTHDIGDTNYAVNITPIAQTAVSPVLRSRSGAGFDVVTYDHNNVLVDVSFCMLVTTHHEG